MLKAKFKILPYPTKKDLKIWDGDGNNIDAEYAKTIPIVKLKTVQM